MSEDITGSSRRIGSPMPMAAKKLLANGPGVGWWSEGTGMLSAVHQCCSSQAQSVATIQRFQAPIWLLGRLILMYLFHISDFLAYLFKETR